MARKKVYSLLLFLCPTVVVLLLFANTGRDSSDSRVRVPQRDLEPVEVDTRIRVRSAQNEQVVTKTSFYEIRDQCKNFCRNYSIENGAQISGGTNTNRTSRGYLLSFRYYEQQTQAARNLFQMQCFGDSFDLAVVEPFILNSSFAITFQHFSSSIDPTSQFLTLSDLVDTELMNREAFDQYGYHPISSWKDFIEKAPRQVITHCIRYRHPPHIPTPHQGEDYKVGCPKECFSKFDKSISFLKRYGFKLVRESCSNIAHYAGSIMPENFMENVLGKYKTSDVTILINEFRGFFGLYRLPVLSECGIKHHKLSVPVMPSVRIQTDARKYTRDVFHGRPYVAILARIERVVFQLKYDVTQCAKEVDAILKQLRSSHKISDIFLAMDVGKFGSQGAYLKKLQPHGETLFQHLYQESWSFKEWEETFERFASSNNSAYIANLQRTIAAKGDCIIMFGGGGFQTQARTLYRKFHPGSKSQCIFKVCSDD